MSYYASLRKTSFDPLTIKWLIAFLLSLKARNIFKTL